MPRMNIFNTLEQAAFESPPVFMLAGLKKRVILMVGRVLMTRI